MGRAEGVRGKFLVSTVVGVGGAAETSTGPTGSRLAGRSVRSALLKALAEARAAQRMTTEHEVRAVLAERVAAAADRAANRGDEAGLLRASARLLELLDTLPVRPVDAPGGGGSGDSSGERGRVLSILDSPPTVGDAADA